MFVVYDNGKEVIVTTKEKEPQTIKDYFGHNRGRNIFEYDRAITPDSAVWVITSVRWK